MNFVVTVDVALIDSGDPCRERGSSLNLSIVEAEAGRLPKDFEFQVSLTDIHNGPVLKGGGHAFNVSPQM